MESAGGAPGDTSALARFFVMQVINHTDGSKRFDDFEATSKENTSDTDRFSDVV